MLLQKDFVHDRYIFKYMGTTMCKSTLTSKRSDQIIENNLIFFFNSDKALSLSYK